MNESNRLGQKRSWLVAEGWMAFTQIWVLLCFLDLPRPFDSALVMTGMALLPGFNAALLFFQCRWTHALIAALCFAPLFCGLSGFFMISCGLSSLIALLVPALLTMPLAGAAVFTRPPDQGKTENGLLIALGIGALLVVFSAVLLFASVQLRLSSHGLLHSAIVYSLIDTGIPLENPFFAGRPLIYYWYYHLAAAGLSLAAGKSPLIAFSFLNLPAVAAVVPCLYLAGRAVKLSQWMALFGALIGLLALNPLGPLFFLLRDPSVTLKQIEAGTVLPGQMAQALTLGFDLRLGSSLTKFWNVSSFPQGIALFLFGLYASLSSTRPRWRFGLMVFFPAFALMLVNPLVGFSFFAALTVASLAWLGRENRSRLWLITLTLAVAGALSLPYLLSITGGSGGEALVRIKPALVPFLGVVLAAGPVLLFAAFGALRQVRQKNQGAVHLALFCFSLLIMALLLSFPTENEYKFIRLLIFPCGLLAAPAALDYLKRLPIPKFAAVLLAGALLVPGTVMVWIFYFSAIKATIPLDDDSVQLEVGFKDPDKREVYRFLREETPRNAVVVVHPQDRNYSMGGNMQGDEVPALARRPLYTGHRFYLTDQYPEFPDRMERTARLFLNEDGSLPIPVDGRPLYVLVRSEEIPSVLKTPDYEEVFRKGSMALFLYRKTGGF
ncbi:MAG: DUF2298 domain-containing protein [Planctomycetes bacterium]|nr:DUF2298 domain-containing protein [Planctomycetota bacterium]